ncbi:MAG: FtsX-like permease family protein [Clostridia bacterium]|nr:FtsX-like permease family protein [Clostridia bacterium]
MRGTLYPRLAWDGLRKNRQLSAPYLLTCVCMVAMFYILSFLSSPTALMLIPRGKSSVETMLNLGKIVVLLFSLVFLFYTHSFLIRRRQREFGLYNVLGMGKRDLARVITWESVITFALALAGGLLAGLALSKLAELGLVNLLGGTVDYRVRVDAGSLLRTLICYAAIFALIWLSAAVVRTIRASAVSLMKAESVGEKPPKGNWALALAGVGMLAAAYWLAVSINNPLDALMWFFAAVLMVIVATYLIMIAGSVRLCRLLQGDKGYYYQPKHFVSVSSMAYRMKRNGAGLASICIIATMVLVMLSSTTCLWFGAEDSLYSRYPREINLDMRMNDPMQLDDANLDPVRAAVADFALKQGAAVQNVQDFRFVNLTGAMAGDAVQCDYERAGDRVNYGSLREICLISAADYAGMTGAPLRLSDGEAALLTDKMDYKGDSITLAMGDAAHTWRVVSVEKGTIMEPYAGVAVPRITVIVPDLAAAIEGFELTDDADMPKGQIQWMYGFDTGLDDDGNSRFAHDLDFALFEFLGSGAVGYRSSVVDARADGAADFYGSYGALFFIGILLSAVFLAAAVLIVYYKQVSEGYEDAKRFDIMRKVGMTRREIHASISAQLLMVFALPLAFAGLHLVFAFPMIRRLLTLFSLYNVGLFARTTIISFAAFAAFYWAVYKLTSGVYYRIVSRNESRDLSP